jgi:hypothetical protein
MTDREFRGLGPPDADPIWVEPMDLASNSDWVHGYGEGTEGAVPAGPWSSNVGAFTGSFLTGTGAATTAVPVTGLGFQPKAVIFWWTGRNDSGNQLSTSDLRTGVGYAVSPTDRGNTGGQSDHGPTTTATDWQYDNASCVRAFDIAGALAGALDFTSFDADGFTCVIDTQFAVDLRVHFLALGGVGITNAKGGDVLEPAATGAQATTGLGFAPDVVFFFGTVNSPAPPTNGGHHAYSFGFAARSSGQACVSIRDQDNLGNADTSRWQRDDTVIARALGNNIAVASRAGMTSLDSDGFTLNWGTRALTGAHNWYLALKGGTWKCGKVNGQDDTVTTIPVSGIGIEPAAVLFMGANNVENLATLNGTQNMELCLGAITHDMNRQATAFVSQDGAANANCSSGQRTDAVYQSLGADGSLQALMDVQSFEPGGFTCIMDDADLNDNGVIFYVAVQ